MVVAAAAAIVGNNLGYRVARRRPASSCSGTG
jgi:hypothetical protein